MGNEFKDYEIYFKLDDNANDEYKRIISTSEIERKLYKIFKTIITKDKRRALQKILEAEHLSKKRTIKLLMSKGFDRDTAKMYADTIKPRTMRNIKELIELAGNSEI